MAINVPGVIATAALYIFIAVIGIIAGRRSNKTGSVEEMFLANRNLGVFVSAMTFAATLTGGGTLHGTIEIVGRNGLVWCTFPAALSIGGIIACILFVRKVHGHGYITIMDPFQQKYGNIIGAIPFLAECICNIFWQASLFTALGSTLSFILETNVDMTIIVASVITIGYTVFGGLSSVAHTDVIQIMLIFFGLVLVIIFGHNHPAVHLDTIGNSWIGSVPPVMMAKYLDTWCLFCVGPMTAQVFYQRVLACKSVRVINTAIGFGSLVFVICMIPTVMIGIVGRSTDWNMTDFQGDTPLQGHQWSHVFSMILKFLCPPVVSVIGIALVSAAVMSSSDSAILASGCVFTHNIYHKLIRPQASDREKVWVLRLTICCAGIIGAVVAVTVKTVFKLMILASDVMFIGVFPQLVCVLWIPSANSYGSVCGYIIGISLRILSGEPFLGIPVVIKYPFYDEKFGQLFPFKTFNMIITFLTIVLVSFATRYLFSKKKIGVKYDVLKCFNHHMDLKNRNVFKSKTDNQPKDEGGELL